MTVRVFDAAYKPNLQAVAAAGGVAMSVYLTGTYSGTCAQPSELHAAGLGALGNYEEGAGELLTCGYNGGVSIGQRSVAAYIAKGAPAGQGLGIAYSVDVDCPLFSFADVGDAFDGIKAGQAGRFISHVYGEGALIDYLVESGRVVGRQWLSGSTSFSGWNPSDPNVGMVQRTWTPVPGADLDDVTDLSTLGIWWPNGVTPQGGGTLIQGAFMALTDDQQTMIYNLLVGAFWPDQSKPPFAANGQITTQLTNINQWCHDLAANTEGAGVALGPEIAKLQQAVAAVQQAVAALAPSTPPAPVDVNALATQLAADLGPNLAKQLVGALGAAITKGSA